MQHEDASPASADRGKAGSSTGADTLQNVLLSDEEIVCLIRMYDRAYQVWLNGYLHGAIQGRKEQALDDSHLAELAAQIAVADVEIQADIKATIRQAIRFIDVAKAREATQVKAMHGRRT